MDSVMWLVEIISQYISIRLWSMHRVLTQTANHTSHLTGHDLNAPQQGQQRGLSGDERIGFSGWLKVISDWIPISVAHTDSLQAHVHHT